MQWIWIWFMLLIGCNWFSHHHKENVQICNLVFLQYSVLKKYGLIHFYVTTSKLLQYCLPIQLTFLVMITMFEKCNNCHVQKCEYKLFNFVFSVFNPDKTWLWYRYIFFFYFFLRFYQQDFPSKHRRSVSFSLSLFYCVANKSSTSNMRVMRYWRSVTSS